jgi:hypothetical protein
MKLVVCHAYAVVFGLLTVAPAMLSAQSPTAPILKATVYDSHFPEAAKGGEAWNGITVAHDGTVYYVLSSGEYNVAGQMYSFNPLTKEVKHLVI